MEESCLNRLASLNIYREIEVSPEALIDDLAKQSKRLNFKLKFFFYMFI
jgi:hypothetical protein